MTEVEILERVKVSLGITGEYQDGTIQEYISEVTAYMRSAGVPEHVIRNPCSVGAIARGVADLWNYGSGGTGFSSYFELRLTQLRAEGLCDCGNIQT